MRTELNMRCSEEHPFGEDKMSKMPQSIRIPYPIRGIDERVMELVPNAPTARYLDNINVIHGRLESRRGKKVLTSTTTGTVITDAIIHFDEDINVNQALYKRKSGSTYKLYYNTIAQLATCTDTGFSLTAASRLQGARISTAGGNKTVIATGSSAPFVWDGSAANSYTTGAGTWQITGEDAGTVCSSAITSVAVFAGHIFFFSNSLTKFYTLALNQIAGAVTTYDIGQFVRAKGIIGAGEFFTKQTTEITLAGFAIIGTDGSVVVYSGSNPADVTTWAMVGTSRLAGMPLNTRSVVSTGKDLFVLTDSGLWSVDQVVSNVTEPISSPIGEVFAQRITTGAELSYDSKGQRLIIQLADTGSSTAISHLVYHINDKAWTTWSGCVSTTTASNGTTLIGAYNDTIWRLDNDYLDETSAGVYADVVSKIEWSPTSLGNGIRKRWIKVAPQFRAYGTIGLEIGMISDFETQNRLSPAGSWSGLNLTWGQLSLLTWSQWEAIGWASDELSPLSWKALTGVGTAGALTMTTSTAMSPIKYASCMLVYEQTSKVL